MHLFYLNDKRLQTCSSLDFLLYELLTSCRLEFSMVICISRWSEFKFRSKNSCNSLQIRHTGQGPRSLCILIVKYFLFNREQLESGRKIFRLECQQNVGHEVIADPVKHLSNFRHFSGRNETLSSYFIYQWYFKLRETNNLL